MKTAVSIPDSVFQRAENLAKSLRMSRSELYTSAIRVLLTKHDRSTIVDKLNKVYAEEDSALDPIIEQMQSASLPLERW